MEHICPNSGEKWDCECGKCGYKKKLPCMYHGGFKILDASLLQH